MLDKLGSLFSHFPLGSSDINTPASASITTPQSRLYPVGNTAIETYFRKLLENDGILNETTTIGTAQSRFLGDDIVEEAVCLARAHLGGIPISRTYAALQSGSVMSDILY